MAKEETKSQKWSEFAESTTIHGLNKASDGSTHKAKRVCWLIALMIMLGLYLFIAISSIITYFRWESVTKMSKITKNKLEFPSVSICAQESMPATVVEGRPDLQYWMRYLETYTWESLSDDMRENASSVLGTQLLDTVFYENAIAMLERCEFDREVFDCADFFRLISTETNTCATFMAREHRRIHGPRVTRSPGYLYGLSKLVTIIVIFTVFV